MSTRFGTDAACVKCDSTRDLVITHYDDFDDEHTFMCRPCYTKSRAGKCNNDCAEAGWDGSMVWNKKCSRRAIYSNPPCCGRDMYCERCLLVAGCDHPGHPTCLRQRRVCVANYVFCRTTVVNLCDNCYKAELEQDRIKAIEAAEQERIRLEEQADQQCRELECKILNALDRELDVPVRIQVKVGRPKAKKSRKATKSIVIKKQRRREQKRWGRIHQKRQHRAAEAKVQSLLKEEPEPEPELGSDWDWEEFFWDGSGGCVSFFPLPVCYWCSMDDGDDRDDRDDYRWTRLLYGHSECNSDSDYFDNCAQVSDW